MTGLSKYQERLKESKVYKLWNDIDDKIYIGSTCEALWRRLKDHLKSMKRYPNRRLYKHMAKIGVEHFHMALLEQLEAKDDMELTLKEQEWMNKLNPTLNSSRAYRTSLDMINRHRLDYKNNKAKRDAGQFRWRVKRKMEIIMDKIQKDPRKISKNILVLDIETHLEQII